MQNSINYPQGQYTVPQTVDYSQYQNNQLDAVFQNQQSTQNNVTAPIYQTRFDSVYNPQNPSGLSAINQAYLNQATYNAPSVQMPTPSVQTPQESPVDTYTSTSHLDNALQNSSLNTASNAPAPQDNKGNNYKKLIAGIALIGVAIAAGIAIYRHKSVSNVGEQAQEQVTKVLSDIKFDKGVASVKGSGEKFTGVIQDTLKNGDKISMHYVDGVIQQSSREGSKTFTKIYKTLENGSHKVSITENGATREVVLENIQNAVKKSQAELKDLLAKKDSLSLEEFEQQAKNIQYKSKNQIGEINEIVANKKQVIAAQKAEAEKAAQQAAQKAEEAAAKQAAEQSAKEAAEKSANEAAQQAAKQAAAKAEQELSALQRNISSMSADELHAMQIDCEKQIASLHAQVAQRTEYYQHMNLAQKLENFTEEELMQFNQLKKKLSIIQPEIKAKEALAQFGYVKSKVGGDKSVSIKSATDGAAAQAQVSNKVGKHGLYRKEISVGGKVVGVSENAFGNDMVANLDESYQMGRNALEVKFLGTSPDYKGSGTELIKAAVEDSRDLGFGGRVWVDACGGSLPSDVGCFCGQKYQTSPVPFYYKMGFRMADESQNQAIEAGLRVLSETGVYPSSAPQTGNMSLCREAIEKFLHG